MHRGLYWELSCVTWQKRRRKGWQYISEVGKSPDGTYLFKVVRMSALKAAKTPYQSE